MTPQAGSAQDRSAEFDVVVVGAGFGGIYALYRLRLLGLRVRVFEAGSGVGGTWFWNRYPGARCDIESADYSYSFSPELEQEWTWTERFASQPEILTYINQVVERFHLAADIQLDSTVAAATFDEQTGRWRLRLETGETYIARYCIFATGCLSVPFTPDLPGLDRFKGQLLHTGRWPDDQVDLVGKRVGVIGTGSSGIQFVSTVAPVASELFVFQRTPSYSIPAHNRPLDGSKVRDIKANYGQRRALSRNSRRGYPAPPQVVDKSALEVNAAERAWRYEEVWNFGGPIFTSTFNDLLRNAQSNETAAEFVRAKIAELVDEPAVAAKLTPTDYPIGGKRICVDIDYFTTFNRDNVHLVDLHETPIVAITENGMRTTDHHYELDVLVMATGYDAMTGALRRIDVRGRDGLALSDKWADGPRTFLGVAVAGFPNLFIVTGPGSPSVLCNMVLAIEQHVEWIAGCIAHAESKNGGVIEATDVAEAEWVQHVNDVANLTLYPSVNSWRSGTNIPGKARIFMPYVGGFNIYIRRCDDEAASGYPGLHISRAASPASEATPPLPALSVGADDHY